MFTQHFFLKTLLSFVAVLATLLVVSTNNANAKEAAHGFAMHGALKYPSNFKHFDYANPDAPKGGTLKLAVVGDNFDSFNPFIIKGVSAAGTVGYLYQSLTENSIDTDESFSIYGLIAEKVEIPEDRSSVTFHINPNAKFSDGSPITSDDVAFSFDTFTTHDNARPFFRAYYGDVKGYKIINPLTIKFEFKDDQNKELPLIMGQMNILSKKYWSKHDFGKSSLDIPVGNGPYLVSKVDPGRSITYKRNPNYWAKDLPVNKGQYNFETIIFEYYKDNTVALEAFKAGEYDFRQERTSRDWNNAYVGKMFDDGTLIREEIKHGQPTGMQAFVLNTRKDLFADPLVRKALDYAFDFEWTNTNLFYGLYFRTDSFFENSDLAARKEPASGEVLSILEPYRAKLPESVFGPGYSAPKTGEGNSLRKNLRTAIRLLKEAGWVIKDGKLTHKKDGKVFKFEFLLVQKAFERVLQPFVKNLEKLGIDTEIRLVDTSQYINRVREFDFDVVVTSFGQSESPGNEQRDYWHSKKAALPGSRNLAGVADPVVDDLIELLITAPTRQDLIYRTRALDRVLLSGHYVIPNWYNPNIWIAHHKKLKRPAIAPKSGVSIDTWWIEE